MSLLAAILLIVRTDKRDFAGSISRVQGTIRRCRRRYPKIKRTAPFGSHGEERSGSPYQTKIEGTAMINVYIWEFRGKNEAWGHASLLCDNTYISWWPQIPGQVPSKIQNIYTSHPYRNRSFQDDVRDERQQPDHTIPISGLDETAIKDWWARFGLVRDTTELIGPLPPWSTLSQNCSTIVATALQKGGGDQYARSWDFVWTPKNVKEYAYSIAQRLAR